MCFGQNAGFTPFHQQVVGVGAQVGPSGADPIQQQGQRDTALHLKTVVKLVFFSTQKPQPTSLSL